MSKIKDITDQKFGRLTAVKYSHKIARKKDGYHHYWEFECECGSFRTIEKSSVMSGLVKSCGCLLRESSKERMLKHGAKSNGITSKTYTAWMNMKARCYNPNNSHYKHYGGREIPITVCDRWLESFENFLEDIGESAEGLSLERYDVNGNYEKSNCGWESNYTQSINKVESVYLTYNNKTQHITSWAEELGIDYHVISDRLRLSWTIEEAFNIPVGGRRKLKKYSSQYTGVCWDKSKSKWVSNYKGKYLGSYHCEEEAAIAYDSAVFTLLGDKAILNFKLN